MLEASGFSVAEAADGREALSLLQRTPVDVVLTDLLMPSMDGVGLITAIRQRLTRPPRIIAMTGSARVDRTTTTEEAVAMGAEAVLIKPFTRDQLVRAIEQPVVQKR
jgi:CheY-like chemotaxis protein